MKLVLQSPLSVEECSRRLEAAADVQRGFVMRLPHFVKWAASRKPVLARIDGSRFGIERRQFFKNHVRFSGEFVRAGDSTKIEGRLEMSFWDRAQLSLGIIILLASTVFVITMIFTAFPRTGPNPLPLPVAFAFAAFFLVIQVFVNLPHSIKHAHLLQLDCRDEAKFLEEFLRQTFDAEVVERQPQAKKFPLEITLQ